MDADVMTPAFRSIVGLLLEEMDQYDVMPDDAAKLRAALATDGGGSDVARSWPFKLLDDEIDEHLMRR